MQETFKVAASDDKLMMRQKVGSPAFPSGKPDSSRLVSAVALFAHIPDYFS